MMDFTYHMPVKVRFGLGVLGELGTHARGFGAKRVLIVTGKGSMKRTGILDRAVGLLEGFNVAVFDEVESDPSLKTIDEGVSAAKGRDLIVGLGGGSALDAAKAISAISANGGPASEYLAGRKIEKAGPKIIAIPTTAGTASEVTEVSVMTDRGSRIKKAIRSAHMYPAMALDDPELTVTMPKDVTASSGLDAMAHAVEALVSRKSQPIPDILCMQAAKLVLENLEDAYRDGADLKARENMLFASLMAGFGITHAGAGLAHGISYSLWRKAGTAHGLACGILLPHVMRYNLGHEGGKYGVLAGFCGYKNPEDLICRVESLNAALGVPKRIGVLGIGSSDIGFMVSGVGGGVMANPRHTDEAALASFIESIL
ncbi:MAG: iron-containing alcohol dehydrogenase [Candidatus Altiarchaeota archaeon]